MSDFASIPADSQLSEIVHAASQRPEVRQAVTDIYTALATQIEARKPLCVLSGRCCHFEDYGHRLYTTTMELAALTWELRSVSYSPSQPWDGRGCPFQKGKLCTIHSIRPFGCRIFFCDPTAAQWQQDQYEHFHRELKQHHERLGVPYRYMEWREALKNVGIST